VGTFAFQWSGPISSHSVITTARLILRPWRDADLAPFAALNADPRVMEHIGMTYSPEEDFDHPLIPEGHPLRRHVLYRLRQVDTASCRCLVDAPAAMVENPPHSP
jgi:RimJ/RimL family protein N-acetyltransferase